MSNCLECNTELIQTPGKRPKQYCGNACRVKYHLKKKNKNKPKGKKGRPAGSKNKNPVTNSIPLPKDYSKVKNVGTLSAEGVIENVKPITKSDKLDFLNS